MHRAAAARWLNRALRIGDLAPSAGVPVYLCPAIGLSSSFPRKRLVVSAPSHRRRSHTEAAPSDVQTPPPPPVEAPKMPARRLPVTCSGCGSFTQTSDSQQFGYFDLESKRVRTWIHPRIPEKRLSDSKEDGLVDEALKSLDKSKLEELGLSPAAMISGEESLGSALAGMRCSLPM